MPKDKRNIQVIKDLDGRNIVIINDIIFKGKRHINWKDVEAYLKKYIGKFYEVAETKDIVYIGKDFPDEFAFSKYTKSLHKPTNKVKANISQAIPEIINIATNKKYEENNKKKHLKDAKAGWYNYESSVALPKYDDNHNLISFNIFKVVLIIRISNDGKLYLYDLIKIKKEANKLFNN